MFQVKMLNNKFAKVAIKIAEMGVSKKHSHLDFYKIGQVIGNLPLKSEQAKEQILNQIRQNNYSDAMKLVQVHIL